MQLKRSLHGGASGKKGFGEQCEMVNGDLSLPPSLSLSLCHAVIPPYLSWQERNSAAVWEHSQSLHGSKRRENETGSLSFMHCKHTLHYLVRVAEGNTTITAIHTKRTMRYIYEWILSIHTRILVPNCIKKGIKIIRNKRCFNKNKKACIKGVSSTLDTLYPRDFDCLLKVTLKQSQKLFSMPLFKCKKIFFILNNYMLKTAYLKYICCYYN